MEKSKYLKLREHKLNDLSRRFSASLVTIALSCKSGAAVRAAIENVFFFVEDYARFLDETLVAEEINEPSGIGHGGRNRVCDGGCTGPDAISKPERPETVAGSGSGEEVPQPKSGKERDGSA